MWSSSTWAQASHLCGGLADCCREVDTCDIGRGRPSLEHDFGRSRLELLRAYFLCAWAIKALASFLMPATSAEVAVHT